MPEGELIPWNAFLYHLKTNHAAPGQILVRRGVVCTEEVTISSPNSLQRATLLDNCPDQPDPVNAETSSDQDEQDIGCAQHAIGGV